MHNHNSQTLAYETFKIKNNIAPEILTEIFSQKEINYSLTNSTALQGIIIKTVVYGAEAVSCFGPKMWDILPTEFKKNVSPTSFKKKIHELAPETCPYLMYKTLDFCKLGNLNILYVHNFFCNRKYFIHIKESVETVTDSKPYIP